LLIILILWYFSFFLILINIRYNQNLARENDFFLSSKSSASAVLSQDDKKTLLENLNDHTTLAEPHATDSYQNVLFSLLLFRLKTGVYPRRITVVTHEFKRSRFLECHLPALGIYPSSTLTTTAAAAAATVQVKVIGINPPEEITSLESLVAGEEKNGIGLWRKDFYGVGPELLAKRRRRGWTEDVERRVFVGMGLEPVVGRLVCWSPNGDDDCYDAGWFPERDLLPWNIQ
jgi:hypothetical protein